MLFLLLVAGHGQAAAFTNLNFESASIVPVASSWQCSVDVAAALPGWSVFWQTRKAPFVSYDGMWLDSSGVSILDTNAPCGNPYQIYLRRAFQGNFTVALQGGFSLTNYPERQSASVAQTGLIPACADTLRFDASLEQISGTNAPFSVSVGGENLPFHVLVTHSSYNEYGADVSRFAGQTKEIRFTAYPKLWSLPINDVYLDDIRFTGPPTPVPFTYTVANGSITITGYTGPGGAVTVPSEIDCLPVTRIGLAAFSGTSVTSVTIPDSVSYIGDDAFWYCLVLTNVYIGSGVTEILSGAFDSCSLLTSVYFKGNAPIAGLSLFWDDNEATVYYLPGTTGWGPTFVGRPTVLWNPLPQTGAVSFGWPTNPFGFGITGNSNLLIVVEGCTNLGNPLWSALATNLLGNGACYFSDPRWTNYPYRFYRIRSP